ncbi:type II toxin-antitoxin system Phd/YefM family antitoxin [Streptomyces sp. NPDC049879]|uniref:type II toxin-antitoxin system Phd/YefM family antitoxin n=1 Tax=Streptomyces sp. NPDC049879 TaxID=3365598 RepID=UPI0037B90AEE
MPVTSREARKDLLSLIRRVNEDRETVEIVSRHGNAVLMSADDHAALREGAYLFRSPANARRLLAAYAHALSRRDPTGREPIDPGAA